MKSASHLESILREIQASALEIRQRLSTIDQRLEFIETMRAERENGREFLTREEAAKQLGVHVNTVDNLRRQKILYSSKIGKAVRIDRGEITKFQGRSK